MDKPNNLAEATRKNNSSRLAGLASTLLPKPFVYSQPEPEPEVSKEPEVETSKPTPAEAQPVAPKQEPDKEPVKSSPKATSTPAVKAERKRLSAGAINADEIIHHPADKSVAYKKHIAISEDHHNLLRDLAHESRVPMNVILNNLLDVFSQAVKKQLQNQ